MSKINVFVSIVLLPLFLQAQEYSNIVIGEYTSASKAQKVFDFALDTVADDKKIITLKKKSGFKYVIRLKDKAHIVVIEPIKDEKILSELISRVHFFYPNAYISNVNQEDLIVDVPLIDKEIIEHEEISTEGKTIDDSKFVVEVTQETLEDNSIEDEALIAKEIQQEETRFIDIILVILLLLLIAVVALQQRRIAELKMLISKQSYSTKLNKLFLAKISHELRTSINSISGLARMLLESKLTLSQKNKVKTITSSGDLLVNVINDILDYERLQTNTFVMNREHFNLDNVLRDVGNTLKLQAKEKELELVFDIDKKVPVHIIGDKFRLEQILLHLIDNAIKFTTKGDIYLHVISIEVDVKHVNLLFEVKDSGSGIKEGDIDTLFTKFEDSVDLDSTNQSNIEETNGLSLAITKELVEVMGGNIYVKSTEGKGSSFIFSLMFELQYPQEKRQYRLPSDELLSKRILIIDNNFYAIEALRSVLIYFNYKVEITANIQEAQEFLSLYSFDMLFIDENMFSLVNTDELAQLKKEHDFKLVLIEVIFNHSVVNKDDFDFVDGSVVKPFTKQAIMDVIANIHGLSPMYVEKKESKKSVLRGLAASRILLVEDNEINQKVVLGLLRDTNILIDTANNGQEGVDKVKSAHYKYDLILMDINMPILDGYGATKAIKKLRRYRDVPIIAITANLIHDEMDKINDCGMCEYLGKPIDVDVFYSTLIKYLSKDEISTNSYIDVNEDFPVITQGVENDVFFNALEKFSKTYEKSNIEFKRFITQNNLNEAWKLAHNLNSSAVAIGAESLAAIATKMEEALQEDNVENMEPLLQELTTQLEEVLELIKSYKTLNQARPIHTRNKNCLK